MMKRKSEDVSLSQVLAVLAVGLAWIPLVLTGSAFLSSLFDLNILYDYIRWIIGVTIIARAVVYFLANRGKSGVVYSLMFLAGTLYFYVLLKLMFDGFLADSPWSA